MYCFSRSRAEYSTSLFFVRKNCRYDPLFYEKTFDEKPVVCIENCEMRYFHPLSPSQIMEEKVGENLFFFVVVVDSALFFFFSIPLTPMFSQLIIQGLLVTFWRCDWLCFCLSATDIVCISALMAVEDHFRNPIGWTLVIDLHLSWIV